MDKIINSKTKILQSNNLENPVQGSGSMSKWKEYQFSDLLIDESISYGIVQPGFHKVDGIPIIRVNNIRNGKITVDDVLKVSPEVESKYNRTRLEGGELLITVVGTVGECAMVPNELKGWNVARAVSVAKIKNNFNKQFIRYCFKTDDLIYQMYGNTNDTVQPTLNLASLKELKLILPPLPEQTTIAEVLSSLDDKIDLLHRQNKTLEQLAETLFRQWFVENEKIEVKSEKLGDVIKTTSGGTPSRNKMEYYSNGVYRWVKSKELSGSFIFETEEMITEDALKNSSAKLIPANSILIAMYGATVGEFGILANEATCNQAICALIPNDNYPYTYLFLLTKTNKENLLTLAVGSAQQNISQVLIKEIEVCGDKELVRQFHVTAEPYFQKIKSNTQQIRTLTQLRDTLLPKLMSGEVRVEIK